jgi:hypothetical protein
MVSWAVGLRIELSTRAAFSSTPGSGPSGDRVLDREVDGFRARSESGPFDRSLLSESQPGATQARVAGGWQRQELVSLCGPRVLP